MSLQFSLWKLGAMTVPKPLRIANIKVAFDESGIPADKPAMDKRASSLIRELLWHIEAKKRMQE
ncbi:MAG: hypothetical protein WAL29_15745 [Bacteroidales bacterium]